MAILVGLVITIVGLVIAFQLSNGKSIKRKYVVWGITIMVAIAPFLSFSIGLTYAMMVKDGWSAMIMWVLFPLFFIVGLILLLTGIFKKK